MPIKKSGKIVRIVFAVILLLLLTQNACVQSSWASHRIRRGMTVNQVLQVSGQWTWGHAYSERPAPEPGLSVSFNSSSIHLMGKDEPQKLTSREELAQALEQQMNGHSWSMSLTYLGAVRASFAVFFDAQGSTTFCARSPAGNRIILRHNLLDFQKDPVSSSCLSSNLDL